MLEEEWPVNKYIQENKRDAVFVYKSTITFTFLN